MHLWTQPVPFVCKMKQAFEVQGQQAEQVGTHWLDHTRDILQDPKGPLVAARETEADELILKCSGDMIE